MLDQVLTHVPEIPIHNMRAAQRWSPDEKEGSLLLDTLDGGDGGGGGQTTSVPVMNPQI